jgi:hypothetical protein
MFIVGLFRWWYTIGWQRRARLVMERIDSTMDYFSIGLLARTMFSLFRQDGAGRIDGPLSVKFNAFIGRLLSRIIGACIRFTVLIIGLFAITLHALLGILILAVWAFVPAFPIVGFIVMLTGWIPWQF